MPTSALAEVEAPPQRTMTPHAFIPGEIDHLAKNGLPVRLCAYPGCGRKGRGSGHRLNGLLPMPPAIRRREHAEQSRGIRQGDRAQPKGPRKLRQPTPRPLPVAEIKAARRKGPPAAELAMLAIAIDAALALPTDALGWRLRVRLTDVRGLVPVERYPSLAPIVPESPTEPETEVPVVAEPEPTVAPVARPEERSAVDRRLLRSVRNDKMRELARRAVDQGFRATMMGNGHLALDRGHSRLTISTTSNGLGHAWGNLKATAKRVGVDVTGL